jgi:hypothetical protein
MQFHKITKPEVDAYHADQNCWSNEETNFWVGARANNHFTSEDGKGYGGVKSISIMVQNSSNDYQKSLDQSANSDNTVPDHIEIHGFDGAKEPDIPNLDSKNFFRAIYVPLATPTDPQKPATVIAGATTFTGRTSVVTVNLCADGTGEPTCGLPDPPQQRCRLAYACLEYEFDPGERKTYSVKFSGSDCFNDQIDTVVNWCREPGTSGAATITARVEIPSGVWLFVPIPEDTREAGQAELVEVASPRESPIRVRFESSLARSSQ